MRIMVVIPSRMASTRLPDKPLADICGLPMIVRVLQRAEEAGVGSVCVAAGDSEIVEVVAAYGGRAILTDPSLPSGSDRIWAACRALESVGEEVPDIIINAQGDEPLLPPELFRASVNAFDEHPEADVVTFAHPMHHPDDIADPSKVKVVVAGNGDGGGRALYFSRSVIPHGAVEVLRHIGFYAYRRAALERFVAALPSVLEKQEKLEQLRGLEMGLYYYVISTHYEPVGVDTPADLERVRVLIGEE